MLKATRLPTHSQQVLRRRLRTESNGADDMLVCKGMQSFASVGIPNLASRRQSVPATSEYTHAVKSALPVTAREVSSEILDDHTAPL